MSTGTIYKNIYGKEPHYITVPEALNRIRTGKSKDLNDQIRLELTKDHQDALKRNLPAVCFSGRFTGERKDECLQEHSGFIVLDFDNLGDLRAKQTDIISNPHTYACWVSPRGNGLKVLVRIADGTKHREHFQALQEEYPGIDASGINVSRVCYESFDADIYINQDARVFIRTKQVERVYEKDTLADEEAIFSRIVKWLIGKGDTFQTGERNTFIFKLASACCRFGLHEQSTFGLINNSYLTLDSSFSRSEADRTIRSAYRCNKDRCGTASFEKDVLVEQVTREEVKIDTAIYDDGSRAKDVIYGADVKEAALSIYDHGYPHVDGIGVPDLDELFKDKRGEITVLTGIGNYGKSTFYKWRMLLRILKYGDKFAVFGPEDNPPAEFYHDFVELLFGCDCTSANISRPARHFYDKAYDFISQHIFYVYPKELAPTPVYIKERFLELIVREKVDGVVIDPFNQLSNDYGKTGGRSDKYLETFLSDCARFAQTNNIFFLIVAHPKMMGKGKDGNYECPDVFDIADGAMWNNKLDNILVYHRPLAQTEPQNSMCQFYSKKIRRQKQVGRKGSVDFEMVRTKRRFFFNGIDHLQKEINRLELDFLQKVTVYHQNKFAPVTKEMPF